MLILALPMFLGLATAMEAPERFPSKIIVAWDDGAVIERPISPGYSVFSEPYVRWRLGQGDLALACDGRLFPRTEGKADLHFVYRKGNDIRVFFLGLREETGRSICLTVLFDPVLRMEWLDRAMASRLAWFLTTYLGIPQEMSSKQSNAPVDSVWHLRFLDHLSWNCRGRPTRRLKTSRLDNLEELARSGHPDFMDSYEQMIALVGDKEQSIAWLPEDEFQKVFGWGERLDVDLNARWETYGSAYGSPYVWFEPRGGMEVPYRMIESRRWEGWRGGGVPQNLGGIRGDPSARSRY
jgi:hypothetical protein